MRKLYKWPSSEPPKNYPTSRERKQKEKEHNKLEDSQDLNQATKPVLEDHGMHDPELGFFITRGNDMQV